MSKSKRKYKRIILVLYLFSLPLAFSACTILIILSIGGGGSGSLEHVREMELPGEYLILVQNTATSNNIDFITLLTASINCYKGQFDQAMVDSAVEIVPNILITGSLAQLYDFYKKCYGTVKVHPFPLESTVTLKIKDGLTKELVEVTKTTQWTYSHSDDFGNPRTYGGDRQHLGNDIMAVKGTPIISMTDGVISKIGWEELGGWRIGITDANGTYWYYAHMSQYAEGMHQGLNVTAGTVIGYVGNSGYGPIGTVGKFADHLHLQIGIQIENNDEYLWINPYNLVEFMDPNRLVINESR